jgi:hypothetical protein
MKVEWELFGKRKGTKGQGETSDVIEVMIKHV